LIRGKTQLYLEAGVRAVWLVDPEEQTVRIHRAGKPPELLNVDQRLCDSTDLIGFDVSVREFFDSRL
jgi:Uma2 family endonuclease